MSEGAWVHRYLEANSLRIHYVRHGSGAPLVLLHGWPEFWLTFRKNIPPLAEHFDVVAPDLRGFGDTEKPGLPDPPSHLLDELMAWYNVEIDNRAGGKRPGRSPFPLPHSLRTAHSRYRL